MQDTGVGTGRDDGGVSGKLRAVATKLVQQRGFQMVFAHILAITQHARTQLHGANMGGGADLRGTAHGVLFVRVFDQTHFI